MSDVRGQTPALQMTVLDLIAEYDRKTACIADEIAALNAAHDRIGMAASIQGTFVDTVTSRPHLHESSLQKLLLQSGWKAIYNRLQVDRIASAKDKKLFERTIAEPPPLTFDNAKATFGDYFTRPRYHILRGLAETFADLDPAYKSHSKVRVGVKGLPKRIILTGWGDYSYGYGRDRFRDICNALATYQGRPHFEHGEMTDLETAAAALAAPPTPRGEEVRASLKWQRQAGIHDAIDWLLLYSEQSPPPVLYHAAGILARKMRDALSPEGTDLIGPSKSASAVEAGRPQAREVVQTLIDALESSESYVQHYVNTTPSAEGMADAEYLQIDIEAALSEAATFLAFAAATPAPAVGDGPTICDACGEYSHDCSCYDPSADPSPITIPPEIDAALCEALRSSHTVIALPPIDRTAVLHAVERNWNAGPDDLTDAIVALAATPASVTPDAGEPKLTSREVDDECGCPEEYWEAFGLELHMHLNAGKPSNAHADGGDWGEAEMQVTADTHDLARAAIFGWAKALTAASHAEGEV